MLNPIQQASTSAICWPVLSAREFSYLRDVALEASAHNMDTILLVSSSPIYAKCPR